MPSGYVFDTDCSTGNSVKAFFSTDKLPNLVDYLYRMKEKFWPDWETVTLEGKTYTPDHGKIYFQEKVKDYNVHKIDKSKEINGNTAT